MRTDGERRTAPSVQCIAAIRSAIDEALGGKQNVVENDTAVISVEQEFTVYRSHVLAVVQSGTDATIQRAIETARGMGVGTMTAIVGGTPDNNALDAVNNGTVNWNGTDYTGLDLTGSGTDALKAAALTTLLAGDTVPPVVAAIDGVYIAQYAWSPTATPAFGTGTVATDFGFGADAVVSPGPFIRTRTRALTVTLAVTRQPGFPGDGLDRIRAAATAVATGYGVGQQVWANDFLQAAESISGTRVTAITVQYNGADVSGLARAFGRALVVAVRQPDSGYYVRSGLWVSLTTFIVICRCLMACARVANQVVDDPGDDAMYVGVWSAN